MKYVFNIDPLSKPRMTYADKFQKRPVVQKYWNYKEELQKMCEIKKYVLTEELNIHFYIKMAKSWSKKKKNEMNGKPHQLKPDVDNILKGFLDALTDEDKFVHTVNVKKIWAEEGKIVVF